MSWFEWAVGIAISVSPIPVMLFYRRWRDAQVYRSTKEYRRRKFGGAIKVPGRKDVLPLDPPEGSR